MDVLGEVVKLTVLDLPTVSPVSNVISRCTTVVEVLVLVNPGVIVVGETWGSICKDPNRHSPPRWEHTGPCDANATVTASHVVEDYIYQGGKSDWFPS